MKSKNMFLHKHNVNNSYNNVNKINSLVSYYGTIWSSRLSFVVHYLHAMFSFTAYRIRQKLKASSSIAQKSNIVKTHNYSFVLLLKLSTTTVVSLGPLLFENTHLDYDTKMASFTVAFLTGVYIGIAFVFTRSEKITGCLLEEVFPGKIETS